MRIIAGEWKGRPLEAPKGQSTRPTSDRMREALFSILLPRLGGARVLDVFAGSGALALEALSRGASDAVLCEKDAGAFAVLRGNIDRLNAAERARALRGDAQEILRGLARDHRRFDIIFLDPPYHAGILAGILPEAASVLEKGGIIAAESDSALPPCEAPGLTIVESRRYGAALLTLYTQEADS